MPDEKPALRLRPKLAQWMFERNIKPSQAAGPIGVTTVQVRFYLRPFSDPRRMVPSVSVLAKIYEWTDGAVTVADFYAPELSGRPADGTVLAAARAE